MVIRELHRIVIGDDIDSLKAMSGEALAARLRQGIEHLSPTVSDLNELGVGLLRERRYALARECFAIAASDSDAVGARANLGRCELLLGRPAIAEAIGQSLSAGAPWLAQAWQLLGESIAAQGRHGESIGAFRRAIACAPGHGALHRQLGDAFERADDAESACVAYARSLAIDEGDIASLRSLVFIKRRIHDWRGLAALSERLKKAVGSGRGGVSPFDFLAEGAGAGLERVCEAPGVTISPFGSIGRKQSAPHHRRG